MIRTAPGVPQTDARIVALAGAIIFVLAVVVAFIEGEASRREDLRDEAVSVREDQRIPAPAGAETSKRKGE